VTASRLWDVIVVGAGPAGSTAAALLAGRGAEFIGPEEGGMLACGYEGPGRLWKVEGIVERVEEMLAAADEERIV